MSRDGAWRSIPSFFCALLLALWASPQRPGYDYSVWTYILLAPVVPLLCSGVLLFFPRRWTTIAARSIHFLLLGCIIDLVPFYALFVLSPFHWGVLPMVGPPTLLVVANSLVTLLLTSATRGQLVRSFVIPVAAAVLILPAAGAGWAVWIELSRAYAHLRYRRSPLAASERAGGWEIVMNDIRTGQVLRWRQGEFQPVPPFKFESRELDFSGGLFDVAKGRIGLLQDRHPSIIEISTGRVLARAGAIYDPPCMRFDADGALVFPVSKGNSSSVDVWNLRSEVSLVRLRSGGTGAPETEVLPAPFFPDQCPSGSADGRLILWPGEKTLRLTSRKGNALEEVGRWPRNGYAFLSLDGRFILMFRGPEVMRLDVATGATSPLARLPIAVIEGNPRFWTSEDDALWPQTFSPDGKWFLLSSRREKRCERSFFALDLERGDVLKLPLYRPLAGEGECDDKDFTSTDPGVVRWVVGANDPSGIVQSETATALQQTGGTSVVQIREWIAGLAVVKYGAARVELQSALMKAGPAGVQEMIRALKSDPSADVRRGVADILGGMGADAKPAIPALLTAMSDPEVSNTAGTALLALKIDIVPKLVQALASKDKRMRRAAASTFAGMDQPPVSALPALTRALADPDMDDLSQVAYALRKMGPAAKPAVPQLLKAAVQGKYNTGEILSALAKISPGDPAVVAAIENGIKQKEDANKRHGAIQAAEDSGQAGRYAPLLIEALSDNDQRVRELADAILKNHPEIKIPPRPR